MGLDEVLVRVRGPVESGAEGTTMTDWKGGSAPVPAKRKPRRDAGPWETGIAGLVAGLVLGVLLHPVVPGSVTQHLPGACRGHQNDVREATLAVRDNRDDPLARAELVEAAEAAERRPDCFSDYDFSQVRAVLDALDEQPAPP